MNNHNLFYVINHVLILVRRVLSLVLFFVLISILFLLIKPLTRWTTWNDLFTLLSFPSFLTALFTTISLPITWWRPYPSKHHRGNREISEVFWPSCNRRTGRWYFVRDEKTSMWRPGCQHRWIAYKAVCNTGQVGQHNPCLLSVLWRWYE